VANGQIREVLAVAKPVLHELRDRRENSPHIRFELASAWIAAALQFEAYPPSCTRKLEIDGKSQEVFLQFFIEHAKLLNESQGKKILGMNEMMVFDYLIWNTDRHYTNCLVKDDKVIPIDHGNSFNNEEGQTLKFLVADMESELLDGSIPLSMKDNIISLSNPESELGRLLRKKLSGF